MKSDCLFCKIIAKEIPSKMAHEDELCVAFYDIRPRAKTHLLIVPKKHIDTIKHLEEGDEQLVGWMVKVAKELAEKLSLNAYNLKINVGKEAGQEIFHIHLHLLAD